MKQLVLDDLYYPLALAYMAVVAFGLGLILGWLI